MKFLLPQGEIEGYYSVYGTFKSVILLCVHVYMYVYLWHVCST